MGCNCRKRKSLVYIRNLAKTYSINTKQDIQIFEYNVGNQKLYNFEPTNNHRENIIEIIKWQEAE